MYIREFLIAAIAGSLALTGCGGGGAGANTCSTQSSFAITGTGYPSQITLAINKPMTSIAPVLNTLPDSCGGEKQFIVSFGLLPKGLTLDPTTGAISGTPVELSTTISAPNLPGGVVVVPSIVTITLKLPGYKDSIIGTINITIQ